MDQPLKALAHFSKDQRALMFIDGANFYNACISLDLHADFGRLAHIFRAHCNLIRPHYYTAILDDEDEEISIRPLIDWLDYNGYTVITKPARTFVDAAGNRRPRNCMNVDIAVDAMAAVSHIDHLILVSGSGDLTHLVECVKDRGIMVSVVSTLKTTPPFVADTLRRSADAFVDLDELRPFIEKPLLKDRAA